MKYKKLLISILVFLSIFVIYVFNNDKKMNYVPLGDSLAAGQTPYGQIGYGYTDYIANYLSRNKLLKNYIKGFAESGDKIGDLLDDIKTNKTIQIDDKLINIKSSLRESDLVTISIGANDFIANFNLMSITSDLEEMNLVEKVEALQAPLEEVLKEVRKYAKNEIIVLGYYNPLPRMTTNFQEEIDHLFEYTDNMYKTICEKYHMKYLPMYQKFKNHNDYLPNPLDIHPNTKGYEVMSNEVIDHLEKNILNKLAKS